MCNPHSNNSVTHMLGTHNISIFYHYIWFTLPHPFSITQKSAVISFIRLCFSFWLQSHQLTNIMYLLSATRKFIPLSKKNHAANCILTHSSCDLEISSYLRQKFHIFILMEVPVATCACNQLANYVNHMGECSLSDTHQNRPCTYN